MQRRTPIDVADPAARRRFFLERAVRKNTRGAGSDLNHLLRTSAQPDGGSMRGIDFGEVLVMLLDAHAAAVYAPERTTADVDYFTAPEHFAAAEARLRGAGWQKRRGLAFPNTRLGLFGAAWTAPAGGDEIDVISSDRQWASDAFAAAEVRGRSGARVMPLPFLLLIKLDSARAVDQGDLSRMLGRLTREEIEEIVRVVEAHYDDSSAADDIRQYAAIGRWEYETDGR